MKIYDPPPSSFDASPTFTGTVTFPDGSTWTSSGVTMASGNISGTGAGYLTIFGPNGQGVSLGTGSSAFYVSDAGGFYPSSNNSRFLGAVGNAWSNIATTTLTSGAATFSGAVTVPGAAVAALTSTATFTSGAAASLGTLTNAPSAGNPTSWIKIVDNGVTRYIPAW